MRKRTGTPWMPAPEFARTLTGLTVNLLVRDVAASLPFYTDVLALRLLYGDEDFAAEEGKRGTGAEIRILGLNPDEVEARARAGAFTVNVPTQTFPHGWRECRLEDANGYMFAVGVLPG